jgi:hypothetical protein
MDPNVLSSCVLSFIAVFILLGVLALLIRIIAALFPDGSERSDSALVAAIHTAAAVKFPEARITRIEEIRK